LEHSKHVYNQDKLIRFVIKRGAPMKNR